MCVAEQTLRPCLVADFFGGSRTGNQRRGVAGPQQLASSAAANGHAPGTMTLGLSHEWRVLTTRLRCALGTSVE